MSTTHDEPAGVAIIGMSLRFPGARTVEEFWRNLRGGAEAITFFSDEELRSAGVSEDALADPRFVKAAPVLDGVELFDAAFFGFHPREAEMLDPQQRLFLECAWQALEDAGYDAARYAGDIGLFAGVGLSSYLLFNVMARPDLVRNLGGMQTFIANDKDYLTTRASFLMGLTGPSMGVQTACSTSLVAVHVACQSLLDFQCDMALAGGAQVQVPQVQGYRYEDGGIVSPDGHTRTFDERSRGTVFGSGVGTVVLKRLEDALADGDTIRAVVRGSAVNNDGSAKVGYTAPSVEGQARVISEALSMAEVDAETISYVEAHGTGTPLGDPIEVEALRKVFAAHTRKTGFCALGSVKTNVGHLNSAAGIAGLIKTVLALEHRQIPPSLHFERPNPQIDFAASPFYVQRQLADWPNGATPRRAGVSSFGIGGTNAHAVVEEAPAPEPSDPSRPWQLAVLSARTATALETATDELATHLERHPELDLADVAFTLQRGRRVFEHRRMLVCRDRADALAVLGARDPERLVSYSGEPGERPVVFLFPGQGAQYVNMGLDLYREEDVFRAAIDRAAEILRPHLDADLRRLLYPGEDGDEAAERLRQTVVAQPALFAVEHALAKLWTSWGVAPEAMLGHSVGEYVAACLAGVFDLEDALALVAARGRLMQSVPRGAMLSVALPAAEIEPLLGEELELAAVNAPSLAVVAGDAGAVERLRAELAGRGLDVRRLQTSHAFHTRTMEPILGTFREEVARRRLCAPEIPFLSNLTGTWIEPGQATDPDYWVEHLRRTVRFADGLAELHGDPRRVLLEVGPGRTLATLARFHGGRPAEQPVVGSLPPPGRGEDDQAFLLKSLGQLWLAGLPFDWEGFYRGEKRRRVRLPTYPFERRRYWIDPPRAAAPPPSSAETTEGPATTEGKTPAAAAHPRPLMSSAYLAPTSEVERTIVEIWQELMGIEPIGVHDDFFELGGHSLLATELTARLSRACGVRLALRELLDGHPTPARLGALVEERRAQAVRAEEGALPALVPEPQNRGEPFPLTDVQHAYWVGRGGGFELGDVATHAYFEIDSDDLDVARFEAAWRRLVARHGMLRAIVRDDGRQRILDEVPPYEVRLLELPDDQAEAERQVLVVRAEMSHQVLPADRWPLFDIRASRHPSGRVRLHVSFDFLIGDAWSLEILRRDLVRCYADPTVEMPEPGVSFRDYVVALRELEGSAPVRRSLEYWRRRLPTLPPGPELPLAKSPGAVARPRFVRRAVRLDAGRWEKLKERAKSAGLTPSGLVAAAFAEVLAVWSKAPRFTLNLTLFNRLPLHPRVHEVVGDFTSLTLLEVDSLAGESFEERARRLQRQLWDDLDHRYVSGVRVLRELGRGADGAARTLMPVVFTSTLTLGTVTEEEAGAETGGKLVYSISQTPQVWLDHQAAESSAGLYCSWDAVEELFPPGLLDDMNAAYGALLERLADDEASWQAGERRLVPEEQLRRRAAVNATAAPVPEGLLVDPFAARARESPQRPALIGPRRTLGYGELARLAWGLGGWLRERGARPNTLVAVVMEKGWEQAAAVLGIQAAGAAYLPVDAGLPDERRRYLIEHGEASLALTQSWLLERLQWPPGVECLAVDTLPPAEAEPPPRVQDPRDLAYVIFTSGSTGLPKGVMIDHRGALNTIADVNRRFAVTARDRVLQISALHFDLSVYDVFGLLAAGGAVVYPEAGGERDPAHWLELARRHEVTIWNTVPALMEMLVTFAEGRGEELPPSLRLVMLSGDWIPLDLPGRVRRLAPGAVVRSLGGATEASIWSILHPVEDVDPSWRSIPYGKPMLNQTFHVLDHRLEPCPDWVPGELYIGGVGLARGYWRDEEKTAASFITHPRTGERLYRTGDLGRYFPDGTIEFLGREDFQVKVRGHRIELGEIEAALAGHPAVRAAVATARGERFESKRLVAYVVPEDGETTTALEAFLAEKLPAHMVPAAIVVLDELPLTPIGKVDRRALPEPEDVAPQGRPRVAPRTFIEEKVAGIWEDVLGVDRVGLDDDFYALGGDSLLATRIVARLRDAFGVEVSLRRFFAAPQVGTLARAVEEARGTERPPLEPLARGRPRPLSFAQERMWFLHELEPESAAYHLPAVLRLRGRLDAAVLERAFEAVVHRHETLRSTFPARDGEPFLAVAPPGRWSLPRVDLAALPEAGRQRELRRLAADDGRRRFDLARGPLLRARLLRLGSEEHVLLFNTHHIVTDGWSNGVLVRELGALYGAFLRGEPAPLPELAVQYADFAAWQRSWLAGGELERQLDYWREQLRGAPAVLALPTDRPPPPRPSGRGGWVRLRLGAADRGAVRALGRERGATLFMTLLAAWTTVLARHSHQHDVVVGTPIAGRGQVELEWLIGFFVNTLMLRADLAGEPTFAELLDRLHDVALEAYAHQDVPFEKLVAELRPRRQLDTTPIFQVMLTLQNAPPLGRVELPGLALEPLDSGTAAAMFDLTLFVTETEEGLQGTLEFARDLFDETTAARLARHFSTLLAAAAADPQRRLTELPLASGAEAHQLLVEWNDTAADLPASTIPALVRARARRHPERVALTFDGPVPAALTYGELAARTGALAEDLHRRGVSSEVRVAISVERSLAMLVGLLGILEADGAYVPLDPEYPRERLRFMLEDCGAPVLVTERRLAELFAGYAGNVVVLDGPPTRKPARAAGRADRPADSLAYVIYTSGSTGRPKGVMNSHRGIVNRLLAMPRLLALGSDDRVLQKTPISFDVSVWELFLPLVCGAQSVIARPGGHRDPSYLARSIAKHRVTTVHFVPSMLQAFVGSGADEPHDAPIPTLRRVIASGEALPADLGQRFLDRFGTPLFNCYGPTEAAVEVTAWRIRRSGGRAGGAPIGRPGHNVRIYVADRRLRPVPIGVHGELLICGVQVARGYLGRGARTAESFCPDPWSTEPGTRLYRTGDLVRHRGDGALDFLGRIDFQVKVRGMRIELGEIETVLADHPGIREAVVMARERTADDRRLVAFVVAVGEPVPTAELRRFLAARLPDYMVPAAFVTLDSMPLNPNGKADRRALAAIEVGEAGATASGAPRSPRGEVLARLLAELLGTADFGVRDDFFDRGGHSLLATRAVARIRQLFRVELSLRELFENPTVEKLLAVLDRRRGGDLPDAILPRPESGPCRLSFAQERLWFLEQLEPGGTAYVIPGTLHFTGELDVAALAAALGEIQRRHESLRTRFESRDAEPVQIVEPAAPFALPLVDLGALARARRAREAERRSRELARLAFDLGRGPLLRVLLLRLGRQDHRVAFSMHHIISDGWSFGVLVRELAALYAALVRGARPDLPELPIQYSDFAWWQRQHLREDVLDEQAEWWRRQLAGAPTLLELPADRPRPPILSSRGGSVAFTLPGELAAGLTALGRRRHATPFMTLLASFQLLLARWSGAGDIAVGSPVANRDRTETENLIGFFLNTLVFRLRLDGETGFLDLLSRVVETALGAYAHQDLPFERLVDELRPPRSLSHSPLFQVLFVHQPRPDETAAMGDLAVRSSWTVNQTEKFDLTLSLIGDETGLAGLWRYSADLFDATTVRRLRRNFETLLESVVTEPERPVGELCWTARSERHQLLVEWNDTFRERPATTLDRLVAAAPSRDAVALVFEPQGLELSRAELDRRVEALARELRRRGVEPESRVAICLERSPEMAIALLGVLRAGGAYVPLDPTHPEERRVRLLESTGAVRLVTRRGLRARFPGYRGEIFLLEELAAADGEPLVPVAEPGHLAYIVHTSGSSGEPKGVGGLHGAAAAYLEDFLERTGIGRDDVVLQLASLSFDASLRDLLGPLAAGARVVLVDEDTAKDPAALLGVMRRRRVTCLPSVVPSLLDAIFRAGEEDGGPPVESVRLVLASGEALPRAGLRRARALFGPRTRLVNQYGPTECTLTSTFHELRIGRGDAGVAPIGRGGADVAVHVLDRRLEPQGIGSPGELFLAGPGLTRGYLGRPAATAGSFLPHPWSGGGRLYRTGDRGRRLADGTLEFLGRLDRQIKLRGIRLEPGEVEAALLACPAVREAAVVLHDSRLVAYVAGEAVDRGDLRQALRRSLPEYAVPATFVALESLPRTRTGKLDRRALPAPEAVGLGVPQAPRGFVEETLAAIWSEVLGRDAVGAGDDFFELGGHSLAATRVLSRLRRILGVEVPLRQLFETPTLAGLGAWIEERRRRRQGLDEPPLVRVPRDGPAPLTFSQQRLWFIDRLAPGNPVYNVALTVRLEGRLDVPALAAAFGEIVRRHEVLRTRFAVVGDEPVQIVEPAATLGLPFVDLSALGPRRRSAELSRRLAEHAERPFDLGRAPLLRAQLLGLAAGDHAVGVAVHHIVFDGWSIGVLVREMAAIYEAYRRRRPSPLTIPALQYADYAHWQRRWLAGDVLERQLAWWRSRLAGVPVLELPADRPRPPVQTYRGARTSFELSATLSTALRELGRRAGATPFMTSLAVFAVLLGRLSGQPDVAVGTVVAGRTRPQIEDLIGFFVNTLALRVDLRGGPDFSQVLARVREAALAADAHQDLPFEKLVEELRPAWDPSRQPLFQVMLVYHNTPTSALELPGLVLRRVEGEVTRATFDLTLALSETAGRLVGLVDYNVDLFDATSARRLVNAFRALLGGVAGGLGQPIARLPLLDSPARHQLLVEWNDSGQRLAEAPERLTLHGLFEAQAAATPAAAALAWEDGVASYAGLDARADALAGRLRRCGIGPGDVVGLHTDRSPEMVVGMLAVMKAGAAYAPLDPGLPRERLARILDDAGVRLVLTRDAVRSGLPENGAAEISLDGPSPAASGRADGGATAGDLAYVIYTSGTSGRPKGVMVPHRGVATTLLWRRQAFGLGPHERVLQNIPFTFDPSLWQIFGPLVSGGRTVLAPPDAHRDLARLGRYMAQRRITITDFPPSVLEVLLGEGYLDAASSLRLLFVGAEVLPVSLHDRFLARHRAVLQNIYGPTEASIDATTWRCRSEPRLRRVPIGRPAAGKDVFLLDPRGAPVPAGVPAELHVGGELARGYLGQPRLTAASFVPDGASGATGGRLYRTGDLARYRADGAIEFLGREDLQVKVRGIRIELEEIEAVLGSHPQVREAAVAVRGEPAALVAYVAGSAREPSPSELRSFLEKRLPAYMVPGKWVTLEALARTAHGKVDRAALPEPADESSGRLPQEPRDPTELALVEIWEELLNTSPIGIDDEFFELGGHSLLAVRMVARIEERLGCELTLAAFLRAGTIENLAHALRGRRAPTPSPLVALRPRGSRPPFFCVHPAGGLVFSYLALARRLGREQPFYALQNPSWYEPGEPEFVIEERAARYLEAIEEVEPEGPYLLGGWSLGGVVAFEIACQLAAKGRSVALLALIDVAARSPVEEGDEDLLLNYARHLGLPLAAEDLAGLSEDRRLERFLAEARSRGRLPPGIPVAQARRFLEIFQSEVRAQKNFVPRTLPHRVVVLRAAERDGADPDLGWGAVSAAVDVHVVPGGHESLLTEPHVEALAACLGSEIDRAVGRHEPAAAALETGIVKTL